MPRRQYIGDWFLDLLTCLPKTCLYVFVKLNVTGSEKGHNEGRGIVQTQCKQY